MIEIAHIQTRSAAGSLIGQAWVDLRDWRNFSAQVVFTGTTLDGELVLETSNDAITAQTLDGSQARIKAAAGHMWTVGDADFRYFRVRWNFQAGAGNISCKAILKEPVVRNA
jgi:hypothetical protein